MEYKYTVKELIQSEYNRAFEELQLVTNQREYQYYSGKVVALRKLLNRYQEAESERKLLL